MFRTAASISPASSWPPSINALTWSWKSVLTISMSTPASMAFFAASAASAA